MEESLSPAGAFLITQKGGKIEELGQSKSGQESDLV